MLEVITQRGCRFSIQGRFQGWARDSHGWPGLLLGIVGSADKEGQIPCSPLFPITSSGKGNGDPVFCSVEAPLWLWHQQSTKKKYFEIHPVRKHRTSQEKSLINFSKHVSRLLSKLWLMSNMENSFKAIKTVQFWKVFKIGPALMRGPWDWQH